MAGIVDLTIVEAENMGQLDNPEKDTWIMRLPAEVCQREGLAANTLISLTIKNGGLQAQFILPPPKKIQDISRQILAEDRELYQRLKELGD